LDHSDRELKRFLFSPAFTDLLPAPLSYDHNGAIQIRLLLKERRPVGLPATGNKRHGVQGSTPVSEGCDRYHPLLLP